MDPAIASVVELLARRVRGVLGTDLVGVYLTGSAVTDGFRPSTSDVDVFVVSGGPPASSVFPVVDAALFRRQTLEYLRDLLSRPQTRPGARPEVVAGWIADAARCLYRLATGELGSKPGAMAWWIDRDPSVGDILDLVDPAVRGDPVAGRACVEAFPTVARRAEALLVWSNGSARAMLGP